MIAEIDRRQSGFVRGGKPKAPAVIGRTAYIVRVAVACLESTLVLRRIEGWNAA
jgi:hypothetical protein